MTVFASTLNNNYFTGACVTLNTLKRYAGTDIPYNIFIFGDFSNEKKDILQRIYPNINYIDITDKVYDTYKLNSIFREWTYNVYNRFEIFTLKATKIIFLDFDLLFQGNIDALITCPYDFAASPRYKDSMPDYFFDNCFDAGVMVIGEKFINTETKNKLITLSQQRIWTSDEPVLNCFFNVHQTLLPEKYNVLTPQYSTYKDDVRVVQFVGKKKPWHLGGIQDRYDDFVLNTNKSILDIIKLDSSYKQELAECSRLFT